MALSGDHNVQTEANQDLVCWTRMQAEAGQGLQTIIARKEVERRAGKGIFFWGVGNAPSVATSAYARLQTPVQVVFSIMKSRPRASDTAPRSLLVWRRYLDMHGNERELPSQALVTSRGETDGGFKKRHYALMCRSETPLVVRHGQCFDPAAYRNIGSKGGPVGASQVTALLQRTGPGSSSDYSANLTAMLVGSYWVRLTDPVLADAEEIAKTSDVTAPQEWLAAVAKIRLGPRVTETPALQPTLF